MRIKKIGLAVLLISLLQLSSVEGIYESGTAYYSDKIEEGNKYSWTRKVYSRDQALIADFEIRVEIIKDLTDVKATQVGKEIEFKEYFSLNLTGFGEEPPLRVLLSYLETVILPIRIISGDTTYNIFDVLEPQETHAPSDGLRKTIYTHEKINDEFVINEEFWDTYIGGDTLVLMAISESRYEYATGLLNIQHLNQSGTVYDTQRIGYEASDDKTSDEASIYLHPFTIVLGLMICVFTRRMKTILARY